MLLARTLRPRHAVVVHPQFTEPEAALRAAGHQVDQVILPFPFAARPGARSPADADLVFVGNPTNPTSVAHPREALAALVRPGRLVVVDEAFADCLPGERESLAGRADLDGAGGGPFSLTKTWALAGLRDRLRARIGRRGGAASGRSAAVAGVDARARGRASPRPPTER